MVPRGILFEPGNADQLANSIERLLDDPDLCQQMGAAGRRRFEEEFTWDVIIDRHYRPLLKRPDTSAQQPKQPRSAEAAVIR